MNRVRHFASALVGLILIAGVGAFLAHPAAAPAHDARLSHHLSGGKLAIAGLIIVLALLVVVSLAKAVWPAKPAASRRPGLPYAAPAKRR